MSDILGWFCFSKRPFRWVKRIWFRRWVLWIVGGSLLVGLPLVLAGVAADRMGLLFPGFLLSLPFQLWVALLAVVSLILALPRLLVMGVGLLAVYLGWRGLVKRLADWAATYEETPNESLHRRGAPDSVPGA